MGVEAEFRGPGPEEELLWAERLNCLPENAPAEIYFALDFPFDTPLNPSTSPPVIKFKRHVFRFRRLSSDRSMAYYNYVRTE